MIFDEIPVIGTFFRSLKTRSEILNGQELYKLEDWEITKRGLVTAREFLLTLSVVAVLPAIIIKNVFQEDYYVSDMHNALDTMNDFLLPFIIFLVASTAAIIVLEKKFRTPANKEICRRAFMYFTGSHTFLYLLLFQLGFVSIFTFGTSPLQDTLPEKWGGMYEIVLYAGFGATIIGGLMLLYYNYYHIPKKLRSIFGNASRDGVAYFFLYFFYMLLYFIALTIAMYLLAYAWASIKN